MSIFENDLFGRKGSFQGLGDVPPGAKPISTLGMYRDVYAGLPSDAQLDRQRYTHYTMRGSTLPTFTFYGDGDVIDLEVGVTRRTDAVREVPAASEVREEAIDREPLLPPAEASVHSGMPGWVPWAVLGGAVVLAGGAALLLSRPAPAAVRANRRRARRHR